MRSVKVSSLGKAIGDPNRAEILCALSAGGARTAGQLAAHVGLAASTTSRHLAALTDAGLVTVEPSGRHRYFRLRSLEIADLLRQIETLDIPSPPIARSHRPDQIAAARTCYDHLAGDVGVRVFQSMVTSGWIETPEDESPRLSDAGHVNLRLIGIDTEWLGDQRRPVLRPCLDGEMQAHHAGGGLGGALLEMMVQRRWVQRVPDRRIVEVTSYGVRQLAEHFGLTAVG